MIMDVLLYRGISPISRLIRWQTRSLYSHAALRLSDGSVVEAWHVGGVRHTDGYWVDHMAGTKVDVYRICAPFDEDAAEKFALAQVGKAYDFKSVFRFLTRRKVQLDDRWFCSELVEVALREGQLSLLNGNPSEHSPRDISLSPILAFKEQLIC